MLVEITKSFEFGKCIPYSRERKKKSSNNTLTIKKRASSKTFQMQRLKDNQNSQVADKKKITFEFCPHLVSFVKKQMIKGLPLKKKKLKH